MNYLVIFLVSFICISLELFWTRILNLKAWNHVVYTVIPFAILGYGIGANFLLLLKKDFFEKDSRAVLGWFLTYLSVLIVVVSTAFIYLPIRVDDLLNIFKSSSAIGMLLLAYVLFMLPFVVIGMTVVYLFRKHAERSHLLYAVDLAGAGLGAAAFFFLIGQFAVFHSLIILALLALAVGLWLLTGRRVPWGVPILLSCLTAGAFIIPEPLNYTIDNGKGWEYVPGSLAPEQYRIISTRWHSLGRTDIYQILDPEARKSAEKVPFTFQINVEPLPEFAYFTTNFLSGTPVYRFADFSDPKQQYRARLFSVLMETPYLLLKDKVPHVFVIGTGGGRDIFMAKTHGAEDIIGAEINPQIVRAMSKGGELYEYSGHVYDEARVFNIDGRHLAKTLSPGSMDFIILNGVDTFSGLSSGAYAYAESYLYTKEAVIDYLRVLNDKGILCFNRWIFDPPRETLRLEAIVFDALKAAGFEKPWEHVLIGEQGWAMTLVRKIPFSPDEAKVISDYFEKRGGRLLFPAGVHQLPIRPSYVAFAEYAQAFQAGLHTGFARLYAYDISVVTDDNPFFYKYYKFSWKDFLSPKAKHHTGSVIFWTQFLVLLQALIFILLFILGPLIAFQGHDLMRSRQVKFTPFLMYFACLGIGYMFIEIPLMQKFVLLLGSPIHSISVILAGLLIWTGIGSAIFPFLLRRHQIKAVQVITWAGAGLLLLAIVSSRLSGLLEPAMTWSFSLRAALTVLLMAPAGILLGFFFPAGLATVSKFESAFVPWAWGINCGFSVLGSMLAIMLAQFIGFTDVIMLAGLLYLVAVLAFRNLMKT